MNLLFVSDHAGFLLRRALVCALLHAHPEWTLQEEGATHAQDRCEYPMLVIPAMQAVRTKGIVAVLICGSGLGMSMMANRFQGIRAALCHDVTTARLARAHNDANILVLGGRLMGDTLALDCLNTFLSTPFEGGRHLARIQALDAYQDRK
jgi:ribose 5-phosphate isomerase B